MSAVKRIFLLVAAMIVACQAGATDDASVQSSVAALQSALRSEYPQVDRWQMLPVSAGQQRRRPKLFARLDGRIVIRRDGNVFQVKMPSTSAIRYRVFGYRQVTVAAEALSAHQELLTGSTIAAERDVLSLRCEPLFGDLADMKWRARRAIKAGETVCMQDVEALPTIARNESITILCEQGGVAVTAQGVALTEGMLGQTIQVRRTGHYRSMRATVLAEGEVDACA